MAQCKDNAAKAATCSLEAIYSDKSRNALHKISVHEKCDAICHQ